MRGHAHVFIHVDTVDQTVCYPLERYISFLR